MCSIEKLGLLTHELFCHRRRHVSELPDRSIENPYPPPLTFLPVSFIFWPIRPSVSDGGVVLSWAEVCLWPISTRSVLCSVKPTGNNIIRVSLFLCISMRVRARAISLLEPIYVYYEPAQIIRSWLIMNSFYFIFSFSFPFRRCCFFECCFSSPPLLIF